jgi:hypothetical protein
MVLEQKQTCESMDIIEGPEIRPCSYSHQILDQGAKIYFKEKTALQQMVLGRLNLHRRFTED